MDKDKLIKICNQVAEDVKNDAASFDGQPFTGKTVGAYMGYHGAAIGALADVLKQLIEKTPDDPPAPTPGNEDCVKIDDGILRCDICGLAPSVIIRTKYGMFCESHVKY